MYPRACPNFNNVFVNVFYGCLGQKAFHLLSEWEPRSFRGLRSKMSNSSTDCTLQTAWTIRGVSCKPIVSMMEVSLPPLLSSGRPQSRCSDSLLYLMIADNRNLFTWTNRYKCTASKSWRDVWMQIINWRKIVNSFLLTAVTAQLSCSNSLSGGVQE